VFTGPFAAALNSACSSRRLTQKQIGELIAVHQYHHRRRSPDREQAIQTAKEQWPRRISAWKNGDRLPATPDDLYLALDVIAGDIPRRQWELWWKQARGDIPIDPAQAPARPAAGRQSARPVSDVIENIIGAMETTYETDDLPTAVMRTGFADLDRLLGGLRPGTLYLVAGEPSVGKTTFTLDLVRAAPFTRTSPQ
jgi:hypothetical protein